MIRVGAALSLVFGLIFAGACSSSNSDSGSACWVLNDGCACGPDRPSNAVPFKGTCSQLGVGDTAICCRRDAHCHCYPVRCGISVGGDCACGVGFPDQFDSCTGTASTCCTQDTGYCYCEEGCEKRFENRVVSSCDKTTQTVTCDGDEKVSSCE